MSLMQMIQATQVRNSFSTVIDTVVREKPVMFTRNRDNLMLMSDTQVLELVQQCSFKGTYIRAVSYTHLTLPTNREV